VVTKINILERVSSVAPCYLLARCRYRGVGAPKISLVNEVQCGTGTEWRDLIGQHIGGGVLKAVPNGGVDVLNDLGCRGIIDTKSFRHKGAAHPFARKLFLGACLGQGCLQDRAHDILHVFLADECGSQRVLNRFHDGIAVKI